VSSQHLHCGQREIQTSFDAFLFSFQRLPPSSPRNMEGPSLERIQLRVQQLQRLPRMPHSMWSVGRTPSLPQRTKSSTSPRLNHHTSSRPTWISSSDQTGSTSGSVFSSPHIQTGRLEPVRASQTRDRGAGGEGDVGRNGKAYQDGRAIRFACWQEAGVREEIGSREYVSSSLDSCFANSSFESDALTVFPFSSALSGPQ